jgi:hypothetical protein
MYVVCLNREKACFVCYSEKNDDYTGKATWVNNHEMVFVWLEGPAARPPVKATAEYHYGVDKLLLPEVQLRLRPS